MAIVRLLLILGLALVAVALLLYAFTRDRRYLRFIRRVAFLLLAALAVAVAWVLFDRWHQEGGESSVG